MAAQLRVVDGGYAPSVGAHRIAEDVEALLEELKAFPSSSHRAMEARVGVAEAIAAGDLDEAALIHDDLAEKLRNAKESRFWVRIVTWISILSVLGFIWILRRPFGLV